MTRRVPSIRSDSGSACHVHRNVCFVALSAAAVVVLSGCRSGARVDTIAGLAEALRKEGVDWESLNRLERGRQKMPIAMKEAFELEGEDLLIEVYRIESERYFKTAALALMLRARNEPENSENACQDVCFHQPFLLAVVEEPEERLVRDALARVFPGKSKATFSGSPK